MTREDKELLLKDLCARLPYGVKIHAEFNGEVYDEELQIVNKSAMLGDYGPVPVVNPVEDDINDGFELTNIKPYLRPISSMTESEIEEHEKTFDLDYSVQGTPYDWLNAHHIDYRGLIGKGLALEAPEGMYKTE